MKLIRETSPYIRKEANVSRMMLDVLIALTPIVLFAVYQFGFRVLLTVGLSVIVMIFSEIIFIKYISKKKITINNYLIPAISGTIYALLMPYNINLYVLIVGALFGIWIGKLFFGGTGSNIVNPAGIGRCFVMIAYGRTLQYNHPELSTGATPLTSIKEIGLNNFNEALNKNSLLDLFIGNVDGSIGEVCKILILISGIYLFVRKSADLRTFLSALISFTLFSFIAGIVLKVNAIDFTLFQLLTGGFLFGAVFMITDPVTTPITARGRILYGILVSGLSLLIRFFGAYPEGMVFAICLINLAVPLIDYYKLSNSKYTVKYGIFTTIVTLFFIVVIVLGL